MRLRLLFLSSALVAMCAGAIAAEPEAKKIKLPVPWTQGQVLHYETERVKTETSPDKREKSVETSKAKVETLEARKDGFVQKWSWSDSKEQVLEGDTSMQEAMAGAAAELEKVSLLIEMDGEGHFKRVRNIGEAGERLLAVMRPIMLKQVEQQLTAQDAAMDPAKRKEAVAKATASLDGFLARFTSPEVLQGLLTKDIQNMLTFTGAELENDQAYVLETVLPNPTGAAAFPGKLTFGLYEDNDEADDIFFEWTLEIDPVKGATAVRETAEKIYGDRIADAQRKGFPTAVSIVDKGFMLLDRRSGVPVLYQNERTAKFGEVANYERNRMRLVGGDHEHEWTEQNPQDTEPQMSADERDAQLCASSSADLDAAVAACSRVIERPALAPGERVRWLVARADHRMRGGRHAQAVADFDKAIALQPDAAGHYIGRANAQLQARNHPAALEDAAKAAGIEPKSVEAQLLQGAAQEGLKDYPRAAGFFAKAIELAPNDPRGHDGRCWTRALAGDYAGARVDCDRALALDPKSANTFNSRGYVHFREGRHAEAVRDYDAAIAAAPGVASSWYVRGLAKRALGDAKGAESDIAKGLSLDPKVAGRYAGYGVK